MTSSTGKTLLARMLNSRTFAIDIWSVGLRVFTVLLDMVELIKKIVQLSEASLTLDDMFQSVNFTLHQFGILVCFSKSLLQSRNIILAASFILTNTGDLLSKFHHNGRIL